MSALTGKAVIRLRSAIGQKRTLAKRLKTPKVGRSLTSVSDPTADKAQLV